MKKCSFCNQFYDDSVAFCPNCGNALVNEAQTAEPVAPKNVCANCGNQLKPGASFCPNCGAKVASAQAATTLNQNQQGVQQPQPQFQPQQSFSSASGAVAKLKNNKKLVSRIAGAAAVVVLVLVIVIASTASSCNNRVESYLKAFFDNDLVKVEKYCLLAQEDVIKTYCKNNDKDVDEFYEEVSFGFYRITGKEKEIKDMSDIYSICEEATEKELEEYDIDVSSAKFEVVSKEKVNLKDSDEKDELIDEIISVCDTFGLIDKDNLSDYIDVDDISKAYNVEVEVSYKEDGEKSTNDIELYVVKYKGKWRVVGNPIGD